jgi:hypothetical protein
VQNDQKSSLAAASYLPSITYNVKTIAALKKERSSKIQPFSKTRNSIHDTSLMFFLLQCIEKKSGLACHA